MFILNIFIAFIDNLLLHYILCCFSLVFHNLISNIIAIILSMQIKKLKEIKKCYLMIAQLVWEQLELNRWMVTPESYLNIELNHLFLTLAFQGTFI